MSKEEFLIQYILTRTSHKRTVEDLCKEAEAAWAYIQSSVQEVK